MHLLYTPLTSHDSQLCKPQLNKPLLRKPKINTPQLNQPRLNKPQRADNLTSFNQWLSTPISRPLTLCWNFFGIPPRQQEAPHLSVHSLTLPRQEPLISICNPTIPLSTVHRNLNPIALLLHHRPLMPSPPECRISLEVARWLYSQSVGTHQFLRGEPCSNLRYSWVTCTISTNFCNFSRLFYLHTLIKRLSCYRTFVIFAPLVIFSLFTLSTHPINAPTVHTSPVTQIPISSYRAHALWANALSQLNRRLWPSCHFDLGIETWLRVFFS